MKLFRSVGILSAFVLVGLTGCSTAARDVSRNDAPVAQVTLSSADQPARVGTVLQGSYQYSDPDGDGEKDSLKAWLRDGQPIDGANQNEYIASAQDSGKKLQFQVTPIAANGTSPGAVVASTGITIENSAPVMTLAPLVGAASIFTTGVGSELRVDFSYSDMDGDTAASAAIRWLRYSSPTSITPIPDATTPGYTVTRDDLGYALVAEVTPHALTGVLHGASVTSPSILIVNSVPVAQNVELKAKATPVIVGTLLTASYRYFDADNDAVASGSAIQWLRNGVILDGVTTPTYTLTAPGDVGATFQFTVTPKASSGTSPGVGITSNTLTVVNSAPQASKVVVNGGAINKTLVDATLIASYDYSDLDLNPQGASVYRWYRDADVISGATSLSYNVVAADSGKNLMFEVTPVATLGISPGISARSTIIPVNNSAPVAQNVKLSANSAIPAAGSVLTASYTYADADLDPEITGGSSTRWLRNGQLITNPTRLSYTLVGSDAGTTITFEVTPKATAGTLNGSATLSNGIVIDNSAPTASNVAITGTAQVAMQLTANYAYGDVNGDAEGASLYEWRNGGTAVIGTAKTYTVKAADAHKTLTVKVTPVASAGSSPGLPVTSPGLAIANSAPSVTGVVIGGSVGGKAYTDLILTANYSFQDADGDAEGGSTYQWRLNNTPIGGETALAYKVRISDVGQPITVQVTPKDSFIPALAGTPVVSPAITPVNLTPVVSNVVVNGKAVNQAGEVLSVSYTYSDPEKDAEPATGGQFRWLRNGATITGAISRTYALTLADAGKTIAAEVTPLAQTGASPGLAVVSNSVVVQPANIALNVSAGLKQLRFSWTAVPGASRYRVSHKQTEGAGFVPLSAASENMTVTNFDWDISVHRINWPTAQFMLEACDANNTCLPSANISALNVMLGAIGYFKASNTESYESFGVSVALSGDGNTLAVGASGEDSAATGVNNTTPGQGDNTVPGAGAVYIFTRSGATWSQQAYVKASNAGPGDGFGISVALSADGLTLAVGGDNSMGDAGAVYVFTRSGTTWSQQAYVKASNAGIDNKFGQSVTLSSDGLTLAVGAPYENSANINGNPVDVCDAFIPINCATDSGAVYVYTRSGATWSQQAYVKASNTGAFDYFGASLALSADGATLAVGAPREASAAIGVNNTTPGQGDNTASFAGAVYVYTRSGATWSQQAYVKASNTGAGDKFGNSVALSGDGLTLAVGAEYEGSAATGIDNTAPGQGDNTVAFAGAVYVFTRSAALWTQQAYVKASNTGDSDLFGASLALSADGNTLAVGAYQESSAKTGITPGAPSETDVPNSALGSGSGAAYVFTRSAALWSQQAYVKASNSGANDYFGRSVALSDGGHTLAVGAQREASAATGVNNTAPGQGDDSAPSAGAVYLY